MQAKTNSPEFSRIVLRLLVFKYIVNFGAQFMSSLLQDGSILSMDVSSQPPVHWFWRKDWFTSKGEFSFVHAWSSI